MLATVDKLGTRAPWRRRTAHAPFDALPSASPRLTLRLASHRSTCRTPAASLTRRLACASPHAAAGEVKLWPQVGSIRARVAVAFWASPPQALFAPAHLPRHLLHFAISPSRRNLLCHAAAADNLPLISSLLKSPEVLTSSITRRDERMRCALDYALERRSERALRMMLRASRRLPPRAREYAFW